MPYIPMEELCHTKLFVFLLLVFLFLCGGWQHGVTAADMYAIKPWGNVILIGCGIGAYATGIGMRWRESNVSIIERRGNPSYERQRHRRCVITEQTVKLLTDLGCTEGKLRSVLRPAAGWRLLAPDLTTLREGATFPGCATGEKAYHCTEGSMLRILRSEFLRFGGSVDWNTVAYDAYESSDGTDTWCLRKDYGLGTKAEAILTMARSTSLTEQLVVRDPERIAVLFDVEQGVGEIDAEVKKNLFGPLSDVAIIVGNGCALHCWLYGQSSCAWRLVRSALNNKPVDSDLSHAHEAVKSLLHSSRERHSSVCALPGTTPAIKDSAAHDRVGLLGDGLLPIDPFEWRGDNARAAVEEASAICRLFYGKKYHRGDVPSLLRSTEQDSLSKRANLLQRDLQDAEHFLAQRPQLESEPTEPLVSRVGV